MPVYDAAHVPDTVGRGTLFPEAAFPAGTLAASENRSGLYLESNGIFEMVRKLVKNTDDVRHPTSRP